MMDVELLRGLVANSKHISEVLDLLRGLMERVKRLEQLEQLKPKRRF